MSLAEGWLLFEIISNRIASRRIALYPILSEPNQNSYELMMLLFGKPEAALLAPLSGPQDTPPINIHVRFDNWNGQWGLGVEVEATTVYLAKAMPTDKEYDENLEDGSGVKGVAPVRIVAKAVKRIPVVLEQKGKGKGGLAAGKEQQQESTLNSHEEFLSRVDKEEEVKVERAASRWEWRLQRKEGEAGSVVFFSTGSLGARRVEKAVEADADVRRRESKVDQQQRALQASFRQLLAGTATTASVPQAQEIHVETPAEVQVFAWGNNQYGT